MIGELTHFKNVVVKIGQSVCLFSIVLIVSFLVGCIQQGGTQGSIAGEWYQDYQEGKKTMRIPSTCDSYCIECPDGTAVSGAIFQDEVIAEGSNAYVFCFGEPSVVTSDPVLNRNNYRNLEHQIMYLYPDHETSKVSGAGEEKLEGYKDSSGRETILDGIWYRSVN